MMLDINSKEIRPGARVAYNRSGYMASGTVKELKQGWRMGYVRGAVRTVPILRIHILNDQDGTVSKVKDKRSVLVINHG